MGMNRLGEVVEAVNRLNRTVLSFFFPWKVTDEIKTRTGRERCCVRRVDGQGGQGRSIGKAVVVL